MNRAYGLFISSWIVLLLVVCGTQACHRPPEAENLSVDLSEITDVPLYGGQYKITVFSGSQWELIHQEDWIHPNVNKGLARLIMTVNISPNLSGKERVGSLTLRNKSETLSVRIHQAGGEIATEEMDNIQYSLPVVFHVLYCQERDSVNQRVPADRLREILFKVNKLYRGEIYNDQQSEYSLPSKNDMKIDFVPAQRDPEGNLLAEPGVNRVEVSTRSIPFTRVMDDPQGGEYNRLAWDRTKYINVFVFRFERQKSGREDGITLGSAHLPYVPQGLSLEGLRPYNPSSLESYNHCIVLNTEAIYRNRSGYNFPQRLDVDAASTLAHELGHYLGLFHVFSESHEGASTTMIDSCSDTDYCTDTRSYNRLLYQRQLLTLGPRPGLSDVVGLFSRTDCEGGRFSSYNLMDYELTDSFYFTPEQKKRMRNCLYYSPIVPGQKIALSPSPKSRSVTYPVSPLRSICRVSR